MRSSTFKLLQIKNKFFFISLEYNRECIIISLMGGVYIMGKTTMPKTLPEISDAINADMMTTEELHAKLQKGYDDIDAGDVQKAAEAFAKFREKR